MKIISINAHSYGPLKNFSPFVNGGEFKRIVALVGVNGAGKTTLISCLLDLMSALKQRIYNETLETPAGELLKIISGSIVNTEVGLPAYFSISFQFDGKLHNFYELIGGEGVKLPQDIKLCISNNLGQYNKDYRIKDFDKPFEVKQSNFDSMVLAFYPADRSEIPVWINPSSKVEFNTIQSFIDRDSYSLWRSNISNEIEQWLLDIILDVELYDHKEISVNYMGNGYGFNAPYGQVKAKIPHDGKNRILLNNINKILSQIIVSGPSGCVSARLAVGQRQKTVRKLVIIGKKNNGEECVLAHNLRALSTGELNIFLIFSDILRIAELNGWNGNNMDDIKGVVVIDEIDTHLHIKLQMELANRLFSLLKSIQFIFTTHSPFLLMGLNGEDTQIYEVPSGIPISGDDYSEFKTAYSYFIKEQDNYKEKYDELSNVLKNKNVPLIITEGKTDWKHLKYASEKLNSLGEIQFPEVEWFDSSSDMGDGELYKVFEVWNKMNPDRKVICIFDRDNVSMVRKIENFKGEKNNVLAIILSIPEFRKDFCDISIEHLYKNDDLKRNIPGTVKRLRFVSEIGLSADRSKVWVENENDLSNLKIYDHDVKKISLKGGSLEGEVAISKNTFLEEIVGKNLNEIDFSGFLPTLKVISDLI